MNTTTPFPVVLYDCKIALNHASTAARSYNWSVKEQDAEGARVCVKMLTVIGSWTEL
jgi:hypothetical protein